jgi:hypothetical protein
MRIVIFFHDNLECSDEAALRSGFARAVMHLLTRHTVILRHKSGGIAALQITHIALRV